MEARERQKASKIYRQTVTGRERKRERERDRETERQNYRQNNRQIVRIKD